MPVLLPHEVCLGSGCLFNSKGKWRRGVVVNLRKSLYDVILIDTGEHVKVTLKSVSCSENENCMDSMTLIFKEFSYRTVIMVKHAQF